MSLQFIMKKPTFNDNPRWWCGACVKNIDGIRNTPPTYCICFQNEIKKRLTKESNISGSIIKI